MLVAVFFRTVGSWLSFGSNAADILEDGAEGSTGLGVAGTIASVVAAFLALSARISFGSSSRLTPDFLWVR